MKIDDVITESTEINEAPAGALTQMGRKIGSKALNTIGAKSKAQNMAGKADLGATANKLHQQFSRYMGTRNKSVNQATGQDLKQFLSTKNVSVNVPNGPIDPKRMDKMLLKVARDAMTKKSRPAGQNTGGQQQSSSGQQSSGDQQQSSTNIKIPKGLTLTASDGKKYAWMGSQWAMIGKSGKPSQLAKKSIGQELNKEANKAISSLPADIIKILSGLTPAQKKIIQSII